MRRGFRGHGRGDEIRRAHSLDPGQPMQSAGLTFVLPESIDFPARLNAAYAPARDQGAFFARCSHKLQRCFRDRPSIGHQP